jgi:Arc/MetJ-type ribon-helix-helix transcriptional regulator
VVVKATKQKTVINLEKAQLERIRLVLEAGRYRTASDFFREAAEEKLERLEEARVAEAVERYCAAGHADEDTDLIDEQAFDSKRPGRGHKEPGRAAR